jgi:cell division protein FtsQ
VSEIDWREPGNLILHTELGRVYCGSYGNHFASQLRALDQLRQLPQKVDLHEIDFIDLRNPQAPLVELVGSGAIELPVAEQIPDNEKEGFSETDLPQNAAPEQAL